MTNKEAKEKLYMEWQKFLENNIDYAGISDAYKMAFKALEQMNVLDKIRAEIDRQEKWLLQAGYTAYNVDIAFDTIKAVIAESEVSNADSN